MNTFRLYLRSMGMLIRSQLQYPASFLLQTLAQLIMEGGEFLAVLLIVDRFDHLNQWTPGNMYFFFGIMAVSFYITEFLGRGITGNFPSLIRTGQLDTLLLRPRGLLTQILCSAVDPRRIICIAVGIAAMVLGSVQSPIRWTLPKAFVLMESILCSILLILGLFLIEAVFCIRSVKSVELVNVLTYGGKSACQYPVDIYPRPLRTLFMIVAPFGLAMHVPAAWILDKPLFSWPAWTAFVCPLSGPVVLACVTFLFYRAMRSYSSAGN